MEFGDILSLGITALGSIFSGGVTGLVGTALTMWGEHKKREQDLEVLRINNAHDLAVMDKEWAGRVEEAKVEGEALENISANEAFAQSYKLEPKRYLHSSYITEIWMGRWIVGPLLGLVDVWRGLIRPGLTTYLVVLITLMYWQMVAFMDKHDMVMTTQQIWALIHMITATVLYTGTTALLWWFGTRNKQQPPRATG